MLIYEWRDFAIYPMDADRVLTREQRLDVSEVMNPEAEGYEAEHGARVRLTQLLFDDDAFGVMDIDDYGSVLIWTRKRVWCLRRESGSQGYREKLIFLPRNPPEAK